MKAIVCTKYGPPADVLQLTEVDKPTPTDNQVLVKVLAASLNKKDLAPIKGALVARLLGTGLRTPKRTILGDDIAGRVEAVGPTVTQFQPGDDVFGVTAGAFAEYACAREDRLVLKPATVPFEAAAAVPIAAITALQALRIGRIQPGHKVLVNGASGGVGTFAVQLAKSFGTHVTAVCSTKHLETARSIGADHVIDYTRADFTKHAQKYDLIIAANGNHSMLDYWRALSPQGRCVVLGGKLAQIFQALLVGPVLSKIGARQLGFMGIARLNQQDLVLVKELLEAGHVKPVIDRRYPLHQTAEAIGYLEAGHARGKVIITVESGAGTELGRGAGAAPTPPIAT